MPKYLEGLYSDGGPVQGHVKRCQNVDGKGIPPLLPPEEIDKSKGMYSFVPRKSILKVIFETLGSNRDWKSRYFFLEGDRWMCHPGETEHILSTRFGEY